MSDNFGEGWVYLIWLIALSIFVFTVIEPIVLHWILRRTTNRKIQLVILGLALLPGYLLVNMLMMYTKGTIIIPWSLLFIGPVAILIPPFVYPDLTDPGSRFTRIFSTYIVVILFSVIFLSGFMQYGSGIFFPVFYSPTIFSNTAIYTGIAILDTLVALTVYRLMLWLYPVHPVQKEQSE